jgi:hypothetical protein
METLPAYLSSGFIRVIGPSWTPLGFAAQRIYGVAVQPDPEPSEDAEGKEPRAGDIEGGPADLGKLSRSGLAQLTGPNVLAMTIQPRPLC